MNSNSYYGFYRGTVVQQLTNGFCKITIPGVLYFVDDAGDLDIDKLPPAECANESFGGTFGNGTFKYPDLQSCVWCFFEGGNVNKPVYFASAGSNSPSWNLASVAVPAQQDIKGYSLSPVTSVGKCSKFGDSTITQTTTLDPNTRGTINSVIKLSVAHTPDNAEKKTKAVNEELGNPRGYSVAITLDNANSKLTLFAADTIEIIAPQVIINGTKLGASSSVKINCDNIELNSNDTTRLTNKALIDVSDTIVDIATENERHVYM